MAESPFELRYQLSRRQRLVPHLKIWGPHALLILLVLAALLASLAATWWAGLGAFLWAWVFRNFFRGLVGVVVYKTLPMDVRVEGNGLGFVDGGERWWVFLDGLVSIKQLTPGVWTLQHWNGSVVNVPADAITDAQLAYLRAATERGRTPEGIRAVIERGRRVAELERGEQGNG